MAPAAREEDSMQTVRVLVVGLGNMGLSHARAYQSLEGFEIVGLCSRDVAARPEIVATFPGAPLFDDYATALATVKPDAVSINTWPDTHAAFARAALQANAHVFIEKPLAQTVAEAEEIVALARSLGRKLMIGYILRVHPSWAKFVEIGRTLGKPLVMRMNLNQQSSGAQWTTHRRLMETVSPIVDCGVHYVDVMCQVTGARPVRVHALGARLSEDIAPSMYNYGCLQVAFDDGSIGWYEAGWGPMMSETAFFVKDMIGPKGSVSIAMNEGATASSDIDSHTRTSALRLHHAALDQGGRLAKRDEIFHMDDEPGHQELCNREQRAFLQAIRADEDLGDHARGAIDSLRIVLAADESIRTGRVVELL
jgi:predicted dehydrogenase